MSNHLPLLFPSHTFLRICLAAVCKPRESPEGRDGSSLLVTLNALPRSGWLPPAPCPVPATFRRALLSLRGRPGPGAGLGPSLSPSPGAGLSPGLSAGPGPSPAGRGGGRGGSGGLCGRLSGGIVSSFLGDSFAVNASLARRGLEDWMVKQKYSGGSSSGGSSSGLQHGCQHRAVCRLSSARVCQCSLPPAPSL